MSDLSMNHEVAAWLASLAKAIEAHGDGQTGHGSYYVAEVRVGYEGEDTGYRVLPNEFGGYDIAVLSLATTAVHTADQGPRPDAGESL